MQNLNDLIDGGYISKRKHPEEDLFILNYTAKTQYEGLWNETTEQCRGLIVDSKFRIRSRCFRKFFNYEEVRDQVNKRASEGLGFDVFEKLDGSLGILYWVKDKPFIATRGSFESEQAIRATKILHEKYRDAPLQKGIAYLFEIIYPENRICVNYQSLEDIVFLSAFDVDSGKELNMDSFPFSKAEKKNFSLCFDDMKNVDALNKEGFVVRFEDGYRFKIKFNNYVRLHSLIFSVSSKSIWNALRFGEEVLVEGVPDELFDWVKECKSELLSKRDKIQKDAEVLFSSMEKMDRKSFATKARETKLATVLFRMLDKRSYDDIIWKMIEPEFRTPRHEEI